MLLVMFMKTLVCVIITAVCNYNINTVLGGQIWEEFNINIWAERHRSIHTEYYSINTKVEPEHFPFRDEVTRDEISGKKPCLVQLKVNLCQDLAAHRTICIYRESFTENFNGIFERSTSINLEEMDMSLKDLYDYVKPVVGFVVREPYSVVKGYIIKKNFYGTIRMYDEHRLYHIVYYVEPIHSVENYNPIYVQAKFPYKQSDTAVIFEYVSHSKEAQWIPCGAKLPLTVDVDVTDARASVKPSIPQGELQNQTINPIVQTESTNMFLPTNFSVAITSQTQPVVQPEINKTLPSSIKSPNAHKITQIPASVIQINKIPTSTIIPPIPQKQASAIQINKIPTSTIIPPIPQNQAPAIQINKTPTSTKIPQIPQNQAPAIQISNIPTSTIVPQIPQNQAPAIQINKMPTSTKIPSIPQKQAPAIQINKMPSSTKIPSIPQKQASAIKINKMPTSTKIPSIPQKQTSAIQINKATPPTKSPQQSQIRFSNAEVSSTKILQKPQKSAAKIIPTTSLHQSIKKQHSTTISAGLQKQLDSFVAKASTEKIDDYSMGNLSVQVRRLNLKAQSEMMMPHLNVAVRKGFFRSNSNHSTQSFLLGHSTDVAPLTGKDYLDQILGHSTELPRFTYPPPAYSTAASIKVVPPSSGIRDTTVLPPGNLPARQKHSTESLHRPQHSTGLPFEGQPTVLNTSSSTTENPTDYAVIFVPSTALATSSSPFHFMGSTEILNILSPAVGGVVLKYNTKSPTVIKHITPATPSTSTSTSTSTSRSTTQTPTSTLKSTSTTLPSTSTSTPTTTTTRRILVSDEIWAQLSTEKIIWPFHSTQSIRNTTIESTTTLPTTKFIYRDMSTEHSPVSLRVIHSTQVATIKTTTTAPILTTTANLTTPFYNKNITSSVKILTTTTPIGSTKDLLKHSTQLPWPPKHSTDITQKTTTTLPVPSTTIHSSTTIVHTTGGSSSTTRTPTTSGKSFHHSTQVPRHSTIGVPITFDTSSSTTGTPSTSSTTMPSTSTSTTLKSTSPSTTNLPTSSSTVSVATNSSTSATRTESPTTSTPPPFHSTEKTRTTAPHHSTTQIDPSTTKGSSTKETSTASTTVTSTAKTSTVTTTRPSTTTTVTSTKPSTSTTARSTSLPTTTKVALTTKTTPGPVHSTDKSPPPTPPRHSTTQWQTFTVPAAVRVTSTSTSSTATTVKLKPTTSRTVTTSVTNLPPPSTILHSTEKPWPPFHSSTVLPKIQVRRRKFSLKKQNRKRRRREVADLNSFFGLMENNDNYPNEENDILSTVDFPTGKVSSTFFDSKDESTYTCQLCIWVQPLFAEKFGLGGGLLSGISEVIDIIQFTSMIFRAIDFNQDGIAENIGFSIKKLLLSDQITVNAETPAGAAAGVGGQTHSRSRQRAKRNLISDIETFYSDIDVDDGISDVVSKLENKYDGDDMFMSSLEFLEQDRAKRENFEFENDEYYNNNYVEEEDFENNEVASDFNIKIKNYPGLDIKGKFSKAKGPSPESVKASNFKVEITKKGQPVKLKPQGRSMPMPIPLPSGLNQPMTEEEKRRYLQHLLTEFQRTPVKINVKSSLSWIAEQLKSKFTDCCAVLGFIYHDMGPALTATSKRGLCSSKNNLGLISGYYQNHKVAKYDVFRGLMHTFGHLFGASHNTFTDPDCLDDPELIRMFEFINPFPLHPSHEMNVGLRPNSFRFSTCSKDLITIFLSSKGPQCLIKGDERNNYKSEQQSFSKTLKLTTVQSRSFCGDGLTQDGEDCDCGSLWQCHLHSPCCGEADTLLGCKIIKAGIHKCHRPVIW